MVRYKIPLILQCLLVFVPLNIYMWGDWILVNLQWAFFRYQYTAQGSGFFPLNWDIEYLFLGFTSGTHNILSVVFWTGGSILLFAGLLFAIAACLQGEATHVRTASLLTFGAGIFYLISALDRFVTGFAIPLGLPVLFAIAYLSYRHLPEPGEDSGDGDEDDEDDGSDAAAG